MFAFLKTCFGVSISNKTGARSASRSVRLAVETLEDRLVPAHLTAVEPMAVPLTPPAQTLLPHVVLSKPATSSVAPMQELAFHKRLALPTTVAAQSTLLGSQPTTVHADSLLPHLVHSLPTAAPVVNLMP